MAYNTFACGSTTVNSGWSPFCEANIGSPVKLFLEDIDHQFDTESDLNTAATWGTDIQARDILPLPLVSEFDDNSDDDVYYTSPITSLDTFIREGKAKMAFRLVLTPVFISG